MSVALVLKGRAVTLPSGRGGPGNPVINIVIEVRPVVGAGRDRPEGDRVKRRLVHGLPPAPWPII